MSSVLIEECDKSFRQYAKQLHVEYGEDAYHTVVCEILERGKISEIRDIQAYVRVAMRWALYKMFRHEGVERRNNEIWMKDGSVPMQKGLVYGRKKWERCRKGHKWSEEMTAYVGGRRTCRICKRERESRDAKRRRKMKMAV